MDKAYFKEHFDQLQSADGSSVLAGIRRDAFNTFTTLGVPTVKHEEWKYTRIGGLFNKEYQFSTELTDDAISSKEIDTLRLPGFKNANELVFINGAFSLTLSDIRSSQLVVLPLEEAAAGEYKSIVSKNLGHSGHYLKDGINALNTAFLHEGAFVHVKKNLCVELPLYIYHIADSRSGNSFSQPRSLVYLDEHSTLDIVETFITLGEQESFTNHVTEIVVEKDARLGYYKIQNDHKDASQVSTIHIRQAGKSYTNSAVISLNGAIIRNNLNLVFEAEHCESHLYGLYCLNGQSHVDNHTVVDNVKPHCFSNELYKGVMDGKSTGVFNGKIFVRKDAQKTNAYQSNENILISDEASVNAKPQLEIFADDVKCSHGCTVGSLDDEALFYLRSRGVDLESARALLLQAFAIDILENIKPEPIRLYVEKLISQRLAMNIV
jgi:Fe-S cluster assembly protein SufD